KRDSDRARRARCSRAWRFPQNLSLANGERLRNWTKVQLRRFNPTARERGARTGSQWLGQGALPAPPIERVLEFMSVRGPPPGRLPAFRSMETRSVELFGNAARRSQEAEQAVRREILRVMATHIDLVARLHGVLCPAPAGESRRAAAFERPQDVLTGLVLHRDVDPDMRVQPVNFLHDARKIRPLSADLDAPAVEAGSRCPRLALDRRCRLVRHILCEGPSTLTMMRPCG